MNCDYGTHPNISKIVTSRALMSTLKMLFIALAAIIGRIDPGSGIAQAQLALTPATESAGWSLTTFAYGFGINDGVGPLGIEFTDAGQVIVSDYDGTIRVFPNDSDGQQAPNAGNAQNYGAGNVSGAARIGNKYYVNLQGTGFLAQFNPDGSFVQNIVSVPHATGMAVNPLTGHLYITRGATGNTTTPVIYEVDPVSMTTTTFLEGEYLADGITTDGNILYVVMFTDNNGGHIQGYRIKDQSLVFDTGYILGADGCALGAGLLTGNLFVNTNFGQVFQINLTTKLITLIASGGARGDFLNIDPNGSLLVT